MLQLRSTESYHQVHLRVYLLGGLCPSRRKLWKNVNSVTRLTRWRTTVAC